MRRKVKSDKSVVSEAMVLTKGNLDEIGDIFKNITEHLWGNIEEQYKKVFEDVHKGLKDLQVQMSASQAGKLQASATQVSGAQIGASTKMHELALANDTFMVSIPTSTLSFDTAEQMRQTTHSQNIRLNLAALPLQNLHELHKGVTRKFQVREKHVLLIIQDVKNKINIMAEEK